MTEINIQDVQKLLVYFSKNTYKAKDADSTSQAIMQRCLLLTELDYTHSVINNNAGDLSAHYPSHLIILEYEKYRNPNMCDTPPPLPRTTETIYESMYDPNKLKELIKSARFARCRSRFPLPVILYKGRHICRSATLSGGPEIYGRSGLDYLFAGSEAAAVVQQQVDEARGGDSMISDWQLFDKVRNQDIKLLKTLNVGTIIDFMVEKKKVKFGMNVTSSEKVDKEKRYSDFTIVSLPYPGCEFFKEFRENDYLAKGLVFDWSQTHVDAQIGVPEDSISAQLRINWDQYQVWDLVKLTQNYLKLILRYLNDSSSGMLIHCISGWDRTPLFVSLLRISLWADGAVHTSLNAFQMLYFTIAYDWMLFGHDLEDRLSKGEEIFFFCFYFLKHIHDEEFSVHSRLNRTRHAVLRNNSDSQLDNVMFDSESVVTLSSVSSNLSLNSWCSSVSQNSRDSQDNNPPAVFHCASTEIQEDCHSNGNVVPWTFYPSPNKETGAHGSRSPLPPNRTSPVAVPVPTRLRQRNESSSSGGSWQMISGTGSLRGSTTANAPITDVVASGSAACKPLCETCTGHASQESSTTIIEDDTSSALAQSRKDRLQCLRRLFYNAYSHTVGFRMKDHSESSGFGQLLGNFAEKVGILSVQRTSL
ncbi:myotubularin-related protein 14 [Cephus cinctus]|uniref:Myotubularin-related protein 14 n=1 Tax=Cephus cinctus TaxID=211228 RepID=A0AAJ7C155_CEPCN|nr:myotubularin-related protein 14 [Cephus cinctus]XP_015599408.1 myotubularin-related protein 14 [Cephus cinctus]XP_015599417.1 myotubularin-related protein 14 [Cephus cinctus]XP_015599428.1 myotubularin-related protein 14 [Cephus cinctus]XP_015599437.1 myotubularin-related protein 14 [Cephus cinctus]XP_015599446.1 myotubularin-related protein 14 [Cephus cinctus]XP_015599455.1 myotubularin-related protein 14 [Cephus cinctus]XP_015599464.1 myotubularin-related protein 14 [Cephus cinctus]XP_